MPVCAGGRCAAAPTIDAADAAAAAVTTPIIDATAAAADLVSVAPASDVAPTLGGARLSGWQPSALI